MTQPTVIRSGDQKVDTVTPFTTATIPVNLALTPSFNVTAGRHYLVAIQNGKGAATANLPTLTARNPADGTNIAGDTITAVTGASFTSSGATYNSAFHRAMLFEWVPSTTGARYLQAAWSAGQTHFAGIVLRLEDTPSGAYITELVAGFGTSTHPTASLVDIAATATLLGILFTTADTAVVSAGTTNVELVYITSAQSVNSLDRVRAAYDGDADSVVADQILSVSQPWVMLALELAPSSAVAAEQINAVSLSAVIDPSELPLTAVGKNLDARWAVRSVAADTLDVRWAARAIAGASQVDLRWALRYTVAVVTNLRWPVSSVVADTLDVRWAVLGVGGAGKSVGLQWAVRANVRSDLAVRWLVGVGPGAPVLRVKRAGVWVATSGG